MADPVAVTPRPVTFVRFAKWCGVTLEPGQLVFAKVAFDGVQPRDLVGDERKLCRQIFGDLETISDRKRRIIAAVCGARSGKSYIMGALRMLHLALTVDVSKLAKGEIGVSLILAPDIDLATQQLNYVKGLVEAAGLKGCVVAENHRHVRLRRSDGHVVEVAVRAIGKGGKGGRARSLIACCIDEANFLNTEGYVVNDLDAFKAANPRIIPGGQMIVCSTPFVRAGHLYELHRENQGKATEVCLSAHAPTVALRVEPYILEIVAGEYERDHANAEREFGAIFPVQGSALFFSEAEIERAATESPELPKAPRPGAVLTCGGDLGLVHNSAALVIAAHYPATEKAPASVELVDVLELVPGDTPLVLSEVCAAFAERMTRWGCRQLMTDGYNREAAREHLLKSGISIVDAPEGLRGKEETYVDTRVWFREDRIRLPRHKRLLTQLGEVRIAHNPGGRVSISSPKKPDGSHGDVASAFVLAAFKKWGVKVVLHEKHVMPQAERDRLSELQRRLKGLQSSSMADLVSQPYAGLGGQAVALSAWQRALLDGGKKKTRTCACSTRSSAFARAGRPRREMRCFFGRCACTRASALTRSRRARTST
ncbi:hypothetical protein K0U83_17405 [bacterium]|nr:hypothetical protein [bacterium]